jgi:hypothetical protein
MSGDFDNANTSALPIRRYSTISDELPPRDQPPKTVPQAVPSDQHIHVFPIPQLGSAKNEFGVGPFSGGGR